MVLRDLVRETYYQRRAPVYDVTSHHGIAFFDDDLPRSRCTPSWAAS
ncbi:hypothetical protein LVJ94_48160 [Pendulispora rubella]|uniref:Uncharacterized protein n=1 Tax=Pendulispora rubella TaxID=2741070 RepID=A0ABZ2L156_9BACT